MIWFIILVLFIVIYIYSETEKKEKQKDLSIRDDFSSENSTAAYYNTSKNEIGEQTILKMLIIKERGSWCEDCGNEGPLQIHHKIPVSKGGLNNLSNLKLLCYNCHQKYHHHDFKETNKGQRKKPSDKYEKIGKSLNEHKDIKIKYQSYNDEITNRIISPLKIVENKGIYYIEAFCHMRNEERKFRISRIIDVKTIEK